MFETTDMQVLFGTELRHRTPRVRASPVHRGGRLGAPETMKVARGLAFSCAV